VGFTPGGPAIAVAAALLVVVVAAFASPAAPDRFAALAPGVALTILALTRLALVSGSRDPFQREQVDRARAAIEALVPAKSLVITSESLGRPAENIAHYTHADARYASELRLLGRDSTAALAEMTLEGRRVFFLLAADDEDTMRTTKRIAQTRVVARRSGRDLYDWFVDPLHAPRGAVLYEAELRSENLELLRDFARRRQADSAAPP
jgi:hypothetical protein